MPWPAMKAGATKIYKGEKSLANIVDECKNYVAYMAINVSEAELKTWEPPITQGLNYYRPRN